MEKTLGVYGDVCWYWSPAIPMYYAFVCALVVNKTEYMMQVSLGM